MRARAAQRRRHYRYRDIADVVIVKLNGCKGSVPVVCYRC